MSVGWNASIDARNFFSSKALFIFRPAPVGNINHKYYCPLLLLWQLKFRACSSIADCWTWNKLLRKRDENPGPSDNPLILRPRKLNRSSLTLFIAAIWLFVVSFSHIYVLLPLKVATFSPETPFGKNWQDGAWQDYSEEFFWLFPCQHLPARN